jgi:hypothetical protein
MEEMMRRLIQVVTAAVFMTAFGAATASAQGFGVRAGATVDPDQIHFGLHYETRHIAGQIHFRPNVELGLNDDLRLLALNGEFVYRAPVGNQWSLYGGGGPALNVFIVPVKDGDNHTDYEPGINLLVGAQHNQGFFTEVKFGFIDSPNVKFTVGWQFK